MSKPSIIKDRQGNILYSMRAAPDTGDTPTWSQVLFNIAKENRRIIEQIDFTRQINEPISVKNVEIRDCVLDFDKMERSSFIDCTFRNVRIFSSSFHHLSDRSDNLNKSIGSLFKNCTFIKTRFQKCDLVMSKIMECTFEASSLVECDMRNVFWFERYSTNAREWDQIPDWGDPFKNVFIKKTLFGHPLGNMMNLPFNMMIPQSYTSIWNNMGSLQRRLTKVAYMMREESDYAFESSV